MPHESVLYELVIDLTTREWDVDCPLDQSLIGPVQYGWDRFQKDPDSITFGGGLLAGSPLPGTRMAWTKQADKGMRQNLTASPFVRLHLDRLGSGRDRTELRRGNRLYKLPPSSPVIGADAL